MRQLFIEFEKNRYEWAFDAKNDFLSRFQLYDAQGVTPDQEKIVLSVYGPTQVGKTTLILSLLGVKDDVIDDISAFLRGKRDIGESATVTVTSYRVSATEDYVLTVPGAEPEAIQSTDVLEDRLSALRIEVEAGRIDALAPVLIALPKSYFDHTDVAIELLDLPGIESAEEREVRHVERCVNYWIPRSHVCLIVNGAGDLTFLRDIDMTHLKHWYDYPDNFYVVLTRAYSPESVKRRLRDGLMTDETELRAYYNREIADILGRRPGTVYPVEIGASLNRLESSEREMARAILHELRERIEQTDYRHVSFSFLTGYYAEVVRESEEEIRNLTEDVETAERERDELTKRLDRLSTTGYERTKHFREQAALLKEHMVAFKDSCRRINNREVWEVMIDVELEQVRPAKSKAVLNTAFSRLVTLFEELLHQDVQSFNQLLSTIYFDLDEVGQSRFEVTRPEELQFYMWDDSKVDRYLSQKNYETQMQVMKLVLLGEVMGICESIYDEATQIHTRLQEIIESLDVGSRQFAIRFAHEREILEQEMRLTEENVLRLQNQLAQTKAYWQQDLMHARQYRSFFIKRFTMRHQELLRQATSKDVHERYRAGLYLYTLRQDAEQIIHALGCRDGNETDGGDGGRVV